MRVALATCFADIARSFGSNPTNNDEIDDDDGQRQVLSSYTLVQVNYSMKHVRTVRVDRTSPSWFSVERFVVGAQPSA
jgi:hypothetical protein